MNKILLSIFLIANFQLHSHTRIIFMSTPRSGTHFLCYTLISLTKQQIRGANNMVVYENMLVDLDKPNIRHNHGSLKDPMGRPFDPKNDILISLIRDPIEVVNRDLLKKLKLGISFDKVIKNITNNFNRVLGSYHNWNPYNCVLVNYEDLIDDRKIESCLKKILLLLGEYNEKNLTEFISNIEYHRKKSIEIMKSVDNYKSITGGIHKTYYRKQMTKFQIQNMENYLKTNIKKVLFDKYLKHYTSTY